jgi:1-deoxy-D-xylulose-5-phosphate synthase
MLDLALRHEGPCAIRYPKAVVSPLGDDRARLEFGKSEVISWATDGMIVGYGGLVPACVSAAQTLRDEGIDVGVINARFLKPLDTSTVLRAIRDCGFVVTVEEAALMGGFGSAVLEAAADAGIDAGRVRRLGIPDEFIEHGERSELLADLGLDAAGIASACRNLAKSKVEGTSLSVD